jgi:hypothetical protein
MNDKNKYLEKLKEIHYFKRFFEIVTKFIVYYNIMKFFKVYKNKLELADFINYEKYYNWLSNYPHVNKIIKEYDNEVNNDLKKIIGLNKKN